MKPNLSVTSIVIVVALTIVAAVYRVATAPERIRLRLDTARDSCVSGGGEWVKVGHEETCRPAGAKKV